MPGLFSPHHDLFRVRSLSGATGACRTRQKPKSLQWNLRPYSVCSAELAFRRTDWRVGKGGATIAGPCQPKNALGGGLPSAERRAAPKEKCLSTKSRGSDRRDSKGCAFSAHPLPPQDFPRNSARQHNWGKARPCRDRTLRDAFTLHPCYSSARLKKKRRALSGIRHTKLYKRITFGCNNLCPMLVIGFRGRPMANIFAAGAHSD
jgi:hypothetical protein